MHKFQSKLTGDSSVFVRLTVLLFALIAQSCTQLPEPQPTVSHTNRADHVANITHWKINGQIAFLQQKKREKASLNWEKEEANQSLKLTTYLGINVLSLESNNGEHTLEVDGKTYNSTDLDRLIWQLTGLLLPSEALAYWVKALPYSSSDELIYNEETQLPKQLISFYNDRQWFIQFKQFKTFSGVEMPTSLTVKQDDLTIKIAIKHWTI